MRRLSVLVILLISGTAVAQENILSLTGGYSTASGTATGSAPTGYKVAVNYDFQPTGDSWTIGGVAGYIGLDGKAGTGSYKITSIPICVVGKYMVGSDKFKAFARVAIGSHFSSGSYSGVLVTVNDKSTVGMSLGFGGGVNFWLSDKFFVTADYEYLWLSNALSEAGGVSSASGGVGMRF